MMEVVKFADIVTRVNTKEDRFNTDKIYYVGGDHIDSNEMMVHQRGIIKGSTIGPMFYCGFKAGDILFVTRNPHLRKCAVVDFDGICSEKTFVLATKDPSRLLQEYLALVMQSDDFWNYCEENKSGGVNFFLNWSTLADYEFSLPSIEEQKILADKLWAAYRVKESYRQLLATTDDMLKAKFNDMFEEGSGERHCVKEIFDLQMGKTPDRKNVDYWKDGSNKWYSIADMSKADMYSEDTEEYISDLAVMESGIKKVTKGTIFMSFKLTIGKVLIASEDLYTNEAIMAFIPKKDSDIMIDKTWNYYCFKFKDWLESAALAVKGKTLNKESIGNSVIIVPSMEEQQEFAAIATQAEATKASLRQSIDAIDRVIRSLINQ